MHFVLIVTSILVQAMPVSHLGLRLTMLVGVAHAPLAARAYLLMILLTVQVQETLL